MNLTMEKQRYRDMCQRLLQYFRHCAISQHVIGLHAQGGLSNPLYEYLPMNLMNQSDCLAKIVFHLYFQLKRNQLEYLTKDRGHPNCQMEGMFLIEKPLMMPE